MFVLIDIAGTPPTPNIPTGCCYRFDMVNRYYWRHGSRHGRCAMRRGHRPLAVHPRPAHTCNQHAQVRFHCSSLLALAVATPAPLLLSSQYSPHCRAATPAPQSATVPLWHMLSYVLERKIRVVHNGSYADFITSMHALIFLRKRFNSQLRKRFNFPSSTF